MNSAVIIISALFKFWEGNMQYRKGIIIDIDSIFDMVKKVINDMNKRGLHQWDEIYPAKTDFSNDIANDTLYVLEDENKIIAVYVISEESDEAYDKCKWDNPDDTTCIIHRLCIDPEYQDQGLGKKIMQHIEEQAREMKYESIRLDVFTQNPRALALYKNSGYEERGFADWRKGRFLLMEKKI